MHFILKKIFICGLLLSLLGGSVVAQVTLPAAGELFRDDLIPRIDLELPADSLAWILAAENIYSNYHFHARFIYDNGTEKDTIDNVGFRLRGNTSRDAEKKSFKVSFNTYEAGRKFHGVEKLNLNGEHNDPTIIRSKICWDIAAQFGLVGARSNHVRLYLNGVYFGLYVNVEHIDEEFVDLRYGSKAGNLYKCLWPSDLDYLGEDPDAYKLTHGNRRVYQLKTNEILDDYSQLAAFIKVLNTTSAADLPCALEERFEVDQYLRYIAFDVLTGNWDGPIFNKNNFYLYENPLTGKINYLPYDLDNTLGVDWIGIDWTTRNIYNWANSFGARPLYKRLLSVSEYKNRVSYYFSKFMEAVYHAENLFPHIDSLKMKMDPWRALDVYAEEDYGFDYNDYNAAFTHGLGNQVAHGLRGFITARRNTALAQLDLKNIFPIITARSHNYPNPTQEIVIKAKLEDDGILAAVNLQYYLEGSTDLTTVEMYDDGLHQDELAGDGIYAAVLPALETESIVHYLIQATDDTGLENQSPKCGFAPIFIGRSTYHLSINEVMASNTDAITDEFGEYEDWIEIYNAGTYPVFLGDKFLSDDLAQPDQWQLPDVTIQPGDFLLFWADNDEKQSLYHTNFKLNAGGEFLGLFDRANNNFAVIDSVSFPSLNSNEVYARLPNGTGDFQFITATPGESNEFVVSQNNIVRPVVRVFPNPTSDLLQIAFGERNTSEFQLQIHDLRGQLIVAKKEVASNTYALSLKAEKLVPGIYFLTVNFAEGVPVTKKIVLQ